MIEELCISKETVDEFQSRGFSSKQGAQLLAQDILNDRPALASALDTYRKDESRGSIDETSLILLDELYLKPDGTGVLEIGFDEQADYGCAGLDKEYEHQHSVVFSLDLQRSVLQLKVPSIPEREPDTF